MACTTGLQENVNYREKFVFVHSLPRRYIAFAKMCEVTRSVKMHDQKYKGEERSL